MRYNYALIIRRVKFIRRLSACKTKSDEERASRLAIIKHVIYYSHIQSRSSVVSCTPPCETSSIQFRLKVEYDSSTIRLLSFLLSLRRHFLANPMQMTSVRRARNRVLWKREIICVEKIRRGTSAYVALEFCRALRHQLFPQRARGRIYARIAKATVPLFLVFIPRVCGE